MDHKNKTTYDDAKSVLKILIDHGHEAMFAGGCVRDRLLNVPPHDYDIASKAPPLVAKNIFEQKGYRVVPTGIDHGTITVVTESGPVEITTLRKDVKTDGRHAVVSFDNASFEDDAARRDFTINAMFEDITGKVHDYHGGQIDLKNKKLRFVGNPVDRIKEDYLRILRFFRFWARLGFDADQGAIQAIKAEALGLVRISLERVSHELWGIFSAGHSAEPLMAMENTGVLKIILPESAAFSHTFFVILRDAETTNIKLRPWIIFSLLLGILNPSPPNPSHVMASARRLRLSEKQAQTLGEIFRGWQQSIELDRDVASALIFAEQLEAHNPAQDLISFYGPIWHFFARHDRHTEKRERIGWLIASDQSFQERRRMQLPVSGKDVMDVFPDLKGRQIGDIIYQTRKAFLNGQWQTRHQGLEFLRKVEIPPG